MKKIVVDIALITFISIFLFSCKKSSTTTSTTTPVSSGVLKQVIYDIDSNSYKIVQIGTQFWMCQDLKVSRYNDGTPILNLTDDSLWSTTSVGAWRSYGNNSKLFADYGKLYNWFVIDKKNNGNKNVCPTGWHVSSDLDWSILSNYLGGDLVSGGLLKDSVYTHWNKPNTGATNSVYFYAFPNGYSDFSGKFSNIGYSGYWWTSTDSVTTAIYRNLSYSDPVLTTYSGDKHNGFSIRCIKDSL